MYDIGFKAVTPYYNPDYTLNYPVILQLVIPSNAIIVEPYSSRKCRTNKVIPEKVIFPLRRHYLLPADKLIECLRNYDPYINIYEESFTLEEAKKDTNHIPTRFISRYTPSCYCSPLYYTLGSLLEIPLQELDTDRNDSCSAGISYFKTYEDTIEFLNEMDNY